MGAEIKQKESLHIAVAIVGFRNCSDVMRCVDALERSIYRDFEIVICENGGSDAFAALVATLGQSLSGGQKITIIEATSNGGYAGGVNQCLKSAHNADAWWILNPDTEATPEALESLVARLQEGDADGVGNTLLFPDGLVQSHGGIWQGWLARAVSIGNRQPLEKNIDRRWIEEKQNYLNGASMIVNRRFVDRAGMMREDYFLYCEEIEWCLRAARRGVRLGYAENASVIHHLGTTTGRNTAKSGLSQTFVYLGHRNAMLLTKDCFRRRLPIVAINAALAILLRFSKRFAWRQLGYAFSGWMAGLNDERGRPEWIT